MKHYLITFITLDGNENAVFIQSTTEAKALAKFETEYEFESIVSCEEDTELEFN